MTNLQLIRIERGLGQPKLARLSGVPQPTISLIERLRLNPTDDELERLARVLEVRPPRVLMRLVMANLPSDGRNV